MALQRSEMLVSTASEVSTFENTTALWPAADGSLKIESTIPSNAPNGPHPFAPGTASALSTKRAPLKPTTAALNPFGSPWMAMDPGSPVIGVLGAGGAVVPLVGS